MLVKPSSSVTNDSDDPRERGHKHYTSLEFSAPNETSTSATMQRLESIRLELSDVLEAHFIEMEAVGRDEHCGPWVGTATMVADANDLRSQRTVIRRLAFADYK